MCAIQVAGHVDEANVHEDLYVHALCTQSPILVQQATPRWTGSVSYAQCSPHCRIHAPVCCLKHITALEDEAVTPTFFNKLPVHAGPAQQPPQSGASCVSAAVRPQVCWPTLHYCRTAH